MFLKSELLAFGVHTVTLYELSALHRIAHLEYIAEEEKKLPEGVSDNELYPLLVARNIRVGARVVAMSLRQGDMEGPDVETLHKQVLSAWPPE
ncbi:phage minor tail protein G, partial [Enterobacteriaceae bacterium H18W14]